MIKKSVISIISLLIGLLLLAGCVDYKAYELPAEEQVDEANLVDEIAAIEEEIKALEEKENDSMNVEEVVLPDLAEESLLSEELQVITVDENELVKLNLKINDPDEDTVTYTFSPPLNQQGEWKTSYGDAGEYLVTISATDGKLTTEKAVKINVNRVNVPPVIEALKNLQVKEGETVTFEPKISDPNKDPVTITVSEPLKSGVFITDHASAGEYQIKVVAGDGELSTEKSFLLTVEDVNVKPEITGLEDLTLKEGETVTLTPVVTDLDGDEVKITMSDPVGDDGVWETKFTDHGSYEVTVTLNDGKDTITKKVKITVEDVNMPPEIVEVSLDIQ